MDRERGMDRMCERERDRRLWKFWKSKNYKQVLHAILRQINSNGRQVNNTQRRYIRTKIQRTILFENSQSIQI